MPPKPTSKDKGPTLNAAQTRQSQILVYLRSTLTAHTLKDLEKSLPSHASGVTSMSVKEHIQALVDEGEVRVEKIGSGNWYWSFGSEEKKAREKGLNDLGEEHRGLGSKVGILRKEIETRKGDLEEDDGGEGQEREKLLARSEELNKRVERLKGELGKYEDGDPKLLEERKAQARRARERAEVWTENCWVLEGYVRDQLGVDGEGLEGLRRDVYGEEYVEGEGLSEL